MVVPANNRFWFSRCPQTGSIAGLIRYTSWRAATQDCSVTAVGAGSAEQARGALPVMAPPAGSHVSWPTRNSRSNTCPLGAETGLSGSHVLDDLEAQGLNTPELA